MISGYRCLTYLEELLVLMLGLPLHVGGMQEVVIVQIKTNNDCSMQINSKLQ